MKFRVELRQEMTGNAIYEAPSREALKLALAREQKAGWQGWYFDDPTNSTTKVGFFELVSDMPTDILLNELGEDIT